MFRLGFFITGPVMREKSGNLCPDWLCFGRKRLPVGTLRQYVIKVMIRK